jgi:hypothetical protein
MVERKVLSILGPSRAEEGVEDGQLTREGGWEGTV